MAASQLQLTFEMWKRGTRRSLFWNLLKNYVLTYKLLNSNNIEIISVKYA